jgi:RNA polymerase II elongation factor ELL
LQRIKSEIVEEYEKNKRDTAYQEARHNFQYLHEKLAHLKQLVHDYDTAQR